VNREGLLERNFGKISVLCRPHFDFTTFCVLCGCVVFSALLVIPSVVYLFLLFLGFPVEGVLLSQSSIIFFAKQKVVFYGQAYIVTYTNKIVFLKIYFLP